MDLRRLTTFALAAALATTVGVARATSTLELTLQSGVSTQTVNTSSCPGLTCVVSFVGAVGSWNLNITSGLGDGSSVGPTLDVVSLNTTSSGAANPLVITLSEDGLTVAPGYSGVIDGNGTVQSVQLKAFWDTVLNGTGNLIGDTGVLVPSGSTHSYHGDFTGASSGNTLTMQLTLTSPKPGTTSFDAALTPVPEPASVALLGGALLLVAGAIRRKSRKA